MTSYATVLPSSAANLPIRKAIPNLSQKYLCLNKMEIYIGDARLILCLDHKPLETFLLFICFEWIPGSQNILANCMPYLPYICPTENSCLEIGKYIFEEEPPIKPKVENF